MSEKSNTIKDDKEEELTREQLKFVDDLLELANKTNRVDYQMLFYEQLMKEEEKENDNERSVIIFSNNR